MKLAAVALVVATVIWALNTAYNLPSCGTAVNCGYPVHDFLHQVIG